MDPSGNSLFIPLIIIIILTAINAFFSAAEIAFVSINPLKMECSAEEGNKKAKRVLELLKDSDSFLATLQVAITLASLLSSALAALTFSHYVVEMLPDFSGVKIVATVIVTIILANISLVLGEWFPKKIALQMPEKVAMATSGIIYLSRKFFRPFVWLLSVATAFLQKITPINFSETKEKFTRDEMQAILSESRETGGMDVEELSMMEGVLSLDSKIAREVMVPRTDTEMLNIEDPFEENLQEMIDSPFSRLPLYQEEKDNVIGVIHVKNLFKAISQNGINDVNLEDIANEPLFVPATIYIDDLLIEFKRQQQHMAILIDEYGGVEGIVTMEDLLEEIVGEIDDETDLHDISEIRHLGGGVYYLNGTLSIEKYNEFFGQHLSSDEFDTIAGLIIEKLGYVPRSTDNVKIRINDAVIEMDHIENGRIYGLISRPDPEHQIEVTAELCDAIEPEEEIED
ncbi:hemolysin family protein [Allofustis seminis]|uniref:hemolysin family protein n=1 Tax=Allofustis seminis TaxID=166939 RepID=UPI000365B6DC|nr:hemolysin family protein [Allofustis seminis]